MQIADVTPILTRDWLHVKVTTDTGITGIGPATFHSQLAATAETVRQFRESLVGRDPLRPDHIWQTFFRASSFRGAAINAALSAIDVALWDIAGKHYGVPVHALLGGRHRDKVRMCALTLGGSIDETIDLVKTAVAEGHTAVKIDPLPSDFPMWTHSRLIQEAVSQVGAVRETVGPDVDICVELHRKMTPGPAVALAQKLEQFDVLFIEDPIQPDSIQSMAEIARQINVPLATGERFNSLYEFREILEAGGANDIKLDVGLQGGFSQCKKIAGLAESYHATVSPHNARGPVLTAAHVQFAAAIPNFLVLEYRHEEHDNMVKEPLKVEDGYITLPDTPGIGIEFDEEAAAKYPYVYPAVNTATRPDGSVAYW
jgi:galactonate dehydratase